MEINKVNEAAETAHATYRAIKALRARGLPKKVFEMKRKELEDRWWTDNKHLFRKQ